MPQKKRLDWNSTAESGQRFIRADCAMAGQDDRELVESVCRSDGASRLRAAKKDGDLAVASHLAKGVPAIWRQICLGEQLALRHCAGLDPIGLRLLAIDGRILDRLGTSGAARTLT